MSNPAAAQTTSTIGKLTALFPKDEKGKPKFITEPGEFNETMEKLANSGLCNLLCAIQYVDYIPPVQAVSLRVIVTRDDQWYAPKGWGDGGFALKGETLAAMFREAGGGFRASERMDDGRDRLYCHIKATVVMRAMNGLDAPFSKDREIDLRPGSPEFEAMRDDKGNLRTKQLSQAQQTILRVCETKAQLRAIRNALSAKQSYSREEAHLPFVIPVLVPNPDMDNPLHAQFMLAHSMGAVEQIYGKKPAQQLGPATVETVHGTVDNNSGEVIDAEVADDHAAHANAAAAADDLQDFEDLRPAMLNACACPCGCQAEVSDLVADLTKKKGGSVRCRECWPGKSFVLAKHKDLRTLGLTPDVTPEQAAQAAK